MEKEMKFEQIENILNHIKGSFSTEQFGVFLNMYSSEIEDNYPVLFHETYHYWQSIFTPFGHLKWGINRSASAEIINLWKIATDINNSKRVIPIADILPSSNLDQLSCVAQIYVQDIAKRMVMLSERIIQDEDLQKIIPIAIEEVSPLIKVWERDYRLNGIDILEGCAKFQEAVFGCVTEGKHFSEVIDPTRLNPEYYVALQYFYEHIGPSRIIEFPIICELALSFGKICRVSNDENWKSNHPAWRFVKLIETIEQYKPEEYLFLYDDIENNFIIYAERLLSKCGYESLSDTWQPLLEYATQTELSIAKDMVDAIEFKMRYPWILSFPLNNEELLNQLKRFQPYYLITTDESGYIFHSESLGQEILFENHFQAVSNQICGYSSLRNIDRKRIQCGYSYYGIKKCPYLIDGTCDGHVDCESELPKLVIDDEDNICEGCNFILFFKLMDIEIKDLLVTNITKRIDPNKIQENIAKLKE